MGKRCLFESNRGDSSEGQLKDHDNWQCFVQIFQAQFFSYHFRGNNGNAPGMAVLSL